MIKRTYLTRGFLITDYHDDNEFDIDDIRLILLPGQLQVCAKDEHVLRVESCAYSKGTLYVNLSCCAIS